MVTAGHDHLAPEHLLTGVHLASGPAVVKAHIRPDRWAAEVHAYLTWVPAVGDHAPRLLGVSHRPAALILAAVPGARLDQAHLGRRAEQAAHTELGGVLRAFHASAPARHGTGITAWLAERGRQWLALAQDLLPAGQRRHTDEHLRELERLGDLPAVPCHLDYTPSNVLLSPPGRVVVLDYEHARYDLAARDLVRLHQRTWPGRADLADAFLDGYGPLSDLDLAVIAHTTPLDRLTLRARTAGRSLPSGRPTAL